MSCLEGFSGGGTGRSLSVSNLSTVGGGANAAASADFATFVTAAIIHTNRFQQQQSFLQSAEGPPKATLSRRPASATTASARHGSATASAMAAKRLNNKVLTKQLSLDQHHAPGHAWTTSAPNKVANGLPAGQEGASQAGQIQNPKASAAVVKKRPPGLSVKNDPEPNEHTKKALKQAKDSRINIKIFLGQPAVQHQDSSDNGVSDTECSVIQREPARTATVPNLHQQQQQQQGNQKAEVENSQPEGETASKHSKQSSSSSSSTSSSSSSSSSSSGRNSSLAQQRRAQYHASSTSSRQNSESAFEKRPPLVRAMSAPIRPIDDNSKFLQSSKRKQARKKKVLRDRDEINECDEDAYEDDPVKNNSHATANNNQKVIPGAGAGQRSRSVLGGPCDIETLVSLLSSGGSDSEKEDSAPSPTTDSDSYSTINNNNNLIGSALKATPRPPMLKKTGKSVSFQESELKQSAGLNRDYYPAGHRKPPALQPIANRIRRSAQLANSLNAFHLKDIKKSSSEESKSDDEKDPSGEDLPPPTSKEQPTKPKKSSTATTKTDTTNSNAAQQDQLVDGQTPKERECYRLFQKMSNMGLSVSYDTILRGMLTPTELRVLQKQKSKLQKQQQESQGSRQNSSESEEGNDTAGSDTGGPRKVDLPAGLVGELGSATTLLEKYATIVE